MNYIASQFYPILVKLDNQSLIGNGTKELLNVSVSLDMNKAEDAIEFSTRRSNEDYIKLEKEWYNSRESSIDKVSKVKIWQQVADDTGQINSNYGRLVYDKSNFNQFAHVIDKLKKDPYTREAVIIYNRPSIHLEANDLNGHDFICTFYQHFFIRNNKLDCIVNMRSNDAIFGLFNDYCWFKEVYDKVYNELNVNKGIMYYNVNSFHVYERHYELLNRIVKER